MRVPEPPWEHQRDTDRSDATVCFTPRALVGIYARTRIGKSSWLYRALEQLFRGERVLKYQMSGWRDDIDVWVDGVDVPAQTG